MAQTAYSNDPGDAVPGMLADNGPKDIVTCIAHVDLPFGRFVRARTDGKVELPTDDTGDIVGLVVFKDMQSQITIPQDGNPVIKAGSPVAILRKGRAYAEFSGGTQVYYGEVHIHNSAGAASDQGKATATAASANVIRDMNRAVVFAEKRTDTLALVEVNAP